ncbi:MULTISPECIES: hypothetical protein [Burkholderia]|uniref:hypothetical protein n=1 Tax=Burkholderia TaxID=32008 RepID=UPI000F5B5699|nr:MULTISPECIES: hypothetical protein [Burkholderia]MBO7754500.1 hypothetical protein [Burkholderia pseudomallei]
MANPSNVRELPKTNPTIEDLMDLMDELDNRLSGIGNLARVCADIAGDKQGGTVQVDVAAMSGTMSFFAAEIASARTSITDIYQSVGALRHGR